MPCTPLSLHSVVPALLSLCFSLMLPSSPACAGTFGPVVYSGGTYTNAGSSDKLNDFAVGTGAWGADPVATYGYDTNAQKVVSGTVTCGDTISASFTWTPDHKKATDPAPDVILTETCAAYWNGGTHPGTTTSGSATNPYSPSGCITAAGVVAPPERPAPRQ